MPFVFLVLFWTTNTPSFFLVIIFKAVCILIFSFINGIFLPLSIKSSTVLSLAPILPEGWNLLNSFSPNFFCFIVEIAMASPIASCIMVEEVGTILPGPASLTSGNKILMSEFL